MPKLKYRDRGKFPDRASAVASAPDAMALVERGQKMVEARTASCEGCGVLLTPEIASYWAGRKLTMVCMSCRDLLGPEALVVADIASPGYLALIYRNRVAERRPGGGA